MAEIFLSYRRDDSTSATGRLADALEAHFGDDRVFRDREISAGENFVEAIRRSVESSTVVLVVIGRRWLGALDAAGRRRLDDPADFVRLEIELALAARVAVVPVLVEGATMPSAADLPPSLAAFSRCQAVELSDTRWRYDADRLIEMLQARFAIESDRAPLDGSGAEVSAITRWGVDLIDLARHPQRLIARRQTGRAGDHVRAFAFLCAAILMGHLVLLTGFDVELIAKGSIAQKALGVASWMLTGLMVVLFVAGLLAAVLALAWR
ncbi:MAG TPA: toll/interleukin-1 receptor domain-containing protein, partial [Caldimonas sp.]|nr:toll/interleukin-1 receptor domain-containing protein [Caldimonas sp.]